MTSQPLASELFAVSQGSLCEGPDECHWCGAPCERHWAHDDLPPRIGRLRSRSLALRPGNGYICNGCWLWRRQRVTVNFLGGGLKDVQSAANWGWYVAGARAWALRPTSEPDRATLFKRLLDPPPRFFLALRESEPSLLQYAVANCLQEVTASSPVVYTLDNKPMTYTIYELEHALAHGPGGTEPGVQALLRVFGVPDAPQGDVGEQEQDAPAKRGRGRPPKVKSEGEPGNPSTRKIEL